MRHVLWIFSAELKTVLPFKKTCFGIHDFFSLQTICFLSTESVSQLQKFVFVWTIPMPEAYIRHILFLSSFSLYSYAGHSQLTPIFFCFKLSFYAQFTDECSFNLT